MDALAVHPLLTSPKLYVADVPQDMRWSLLVEVLKPCGFVRSGGKSVTNGRAKWAVIFADIFHAEMALATLQGATVPGQSPPFALTLSHSPSLDAPYSSHRLLPQFVKGSASSYHTLYGASAQDLFSWFRSAGPLASVQANVKVGHAHPTCILEYWDEKHAQYARENCRMMHPELAQMKPFSLRTFDPSSLFCAGFGSGWRQPDLHNLFVPYGKILGARMLKVGVPDAFGFVSFYTTDQAMRALNELSGKVIGGQHLIVRYHEPKVQNVFRPPFAARSPTTEENTDSWRGNAYKAPRQESGRSNDTNGDSAAPDDSPSDEPVKQQEEQNNALDDARRMREAAEEAERAACTQQEAAEDAECAAQQALADAVKEYESARALQHEADAAVEEAERILHAAKERQMQKAHEVIRSLENKNEVAKQEQEASHQRRLAVREAIEKRVLRDEAVRAEQEAQEQIREHQRGDTAASKDKGNAEPEWRARAREWQDERKAEEFKAREAFEQRRRQWANVTQKEAQERREDSPQETAAASQTNEIPSAESASREDRERSPLGESARQEREREHEQERLAERWREMKRRQEVERREEAEQMEAREREETRRAFEEIEREEAKRQKELRREHARRQDEDQRRQEAEHAASLQESIRKMQLIREQEEAERREKEWQTRLKKERGEQKKREAESPVQQETERRAREEQEKKDRELQERLEHEAQRLKLYREAVVKERIRCQQRDALQWDIRPDPLYRLFWKSSHSIHRFQTLCIEFDEIKFCDSQPLTFESVPWPILHYPLDFTLQTIEWNAVEQFFSAAKLALVGGEYKTMLERAHRRFHPDKWRSRGLLNTVLDEDLRKDLEDAGNIVAQAITPLWLASKSAR